MLWQEQNIKMSISYLGCLCILVFLSSSVLGVAGGVGTLRDWYWLTNGLPHFHWSHGRGLLRVSCSPEISWWRHQIEAISALLAICAGNSPVTLNSPHKGQWRGALMFSLICAWINGWVNNREAGDLRRHRAHCDVTVMCWICEWCFKKKVLLENPRMAWIQCCIKFCEIPRIYIWKCNPIPWNIFSKPLL